MLFQAEWSFAVLTFIFSSAVKGKYSSQSPYGDYTFNHILWGKNADLGSLCKSSSRLSTKTGVCCKHSFQPSTAFH